MGLALGLGTALRKALLVTLGPWAVRSAAALLAPLSSRLILLPGGAASFLSTASSVGQKIR